MLIQNILILVLGLHIGLSDDTTQWDDSTDVHYLESVKITAERREKRLLDMPSAVSTIGESEISSAGTQNVRDISHSIPNLFIPDYGMKLSAPVFIRGVGAKLSSPSVGLYVDDVPYFEKGSFSFDLLDVKRVEVMRGPQGTLFGRNALAGIINVVTQQPGNQTGLQTRVTLGGYGFQRYQLSAFAPVVKDRLFVRASGSYFKRDGYFTNDFNEEDVDFKDEWNARFQLRYTPGQHINISYALDYNRSRDGGYPYTTMQYSDSLPYHVNYNAPSFFHRDFIKQSLKAEWDLGRLALTSVSGWVNSHYDQAADQDFSQASLYQVVNAQDEGTFTQEISLKSNTESRLQWVAGMFGFHQGLHNEVNVNYGEQFIAAYNFPEGAGKLKINQRTNQGAAAFGQATFSDLLPGLDLAAGLRFDAEEARMEYDYYLKNAQGRERAAPTLHADTLFTEWLPKFSISYSPGDRLMAYHTISKGYKAGGFNTTFDKPGEKKYDAEYNWNYEIGVKGELFSRRLQYDFAAFYIDRKNQQVYQLRESKQGSMLKNAGTSHSRGLEGQLSAILLPGLRLSAAAGYTEARFDSYLDPARGADYSGNTVPFVPRYTAHGQLGYQLPVPVGQWKRPFRINTQFRHVGTHFWDDANTLKQQPYNVLDASLHIKTPHAGLALWAKNILGTQYVAYQFNAFGSDFQQLGSPARFGITLKANIPGQ